MGFNGIYPADDTLNKCFAQYRRRSMFLFVLAAVHTLPFLAGLSPKSRKHVSQQSMSALQNPIRIACIPVLGRHYRFHLPSGND